MSLHLFVLILHVLGAGLVLGIVILSVFAVIKPPMMTKALDRLAFVGRFGMWGSAWQFITGAILFLQERGEFDHNPVFWTKIGLYVVEGTLASQLLQRQARTTAAALASGQTVTAGGLRTTLWIHAGLIIAIAVLGVWLVSGGHE
ncbi:MAG: hypothetical protein AAB402_04510 [Patescibacteria group bacterium]